ncbi:MAG: sugar phosphate nucleotidyltransferase [Rickettsiales bacterium]
MLAGGMGERLWPLSTTARHKSFVVTDASGRSLFSDVGSGGGP